MRWPVTFALCTIAAHLLKLSLTIEKMSKVGGFSVFEYEVSLSAKHGISSCGDQTEVGCNMMFFLFISNIIFFT
jgi:hypothetical protein